MEKEMTSPQHSYLNKTRPTELPAQQTSHLPVGWANVSFIDCIQLQTHSASLTHSLPLYHITLPPTGQTMNLHWERYGQRRRTGSGLHNDCGESVLVMWFVTPSALPLMWLRDELFGPAVSDEMVASDRRSRAQTRKCSTRLQSVKPEPGNTRFENTTSAETSGGLWGRVYLRVSVCLNELNRLDSICCMSSHFSLLHTHINLSASDTLCIILVSQTTSITLCVFVWCVFSLGKGASILQLSC